MIQIAEILLEVPPSPFWKILHQVGVTQAVGVLPRRSFDWRGTSWELPWEYGPLAMYRGKVEEANLELPVIEDNPPMDRARLGTSGRDEEIEQFCTLIRNMGRLGIPVLCYNWMAVLGWLRTSVATPGRGGALVTAYDHDVFRSAPPTSAGTVTEERLWDTLRYFLERVVPVAEEAVTLAMHPDDPPLSPIRGIARIMSTVDGFERPVELVPSEMNGITFCQANFALMTGDVPAVIRACARTARSGSTARSARTTSPPSRARGPAAQGTAVSKRSATSPACARPPTGSMTSACSRADGYGRRLIPYAGSVVKHLLRPT